MIDINKYKLIYILFGSVRKIIALLLTIVFSFLCLNGTISSEQFIPIFSMVLGYYFGKSTALEMPGGNIEIQDNNLTQDLNNRLCFKTMLKMIQ